ncbi:MAG: 2-C-methyl-D-erythritol 4-phosphate cytidylyltransferase, partial [Olsenella sp.]
MGESKPLACVEEMRVGEAFPHSDTVAIIVAGGVGERFGDPRGKQFVDLCGLPLMSWAILAFDRAPSVASIVLVCAPDRRAEVGSDVLSKLT